MNSLGRRGARDKKIGPLILLAFLLAVAAGLSYLALRHFSSAAASSASATAPVPAQIPTPMELARKAGIFAARNANGRGIAILCAPPEREAWLMSREFARGASETAAGVEVFGITVDPENAPVAESVADLFGAGVGIVYVAVHGDPVGDPFGTALRVAEAWESGNQASPSGTKRMVLAPVDSGIVHPLLTVLP